MQLLLPYEVCVEPVTGLDLAKDDVATFHLVVGGDGGVGGLVVRMDPRMQRQTRDALHHAPAGFEH
jgi:hypothetical protein